MTKKIETNFTELFDDQSCIADVFNNLDDEDKFLINKNLNTVEGLFLDKHGFNHKSISSKMAAQETKNTSNLIKIKIKTSEISSKTSKDVSRKKEKNSSS